MKVILSLLAIVLFSCHNSGMAKSDYKDSAIYYSNKLAAVTDSGYTQNDSLNTMRKTRATIYTAMRQYYIDKSK